MAGNGPFPRPHRYWVEAGFAVITAGYWLGHAEDQSSSGPEGRDLNIGRKHSFPEMPLRFSIYFPLNRKVVSTPMAPLFFLPDSLPHVTFPLLL